jgi:tryptophan synthase alpha chain
VSRIGNAFKDGKAFIGFVTGGDPSIEKSGEFIREMIKGGADLIEIGVPFSDPIAEGPVIQAANIRALSAGTTADALFGLVEVLRRETDVPIVFLTYLNPVFHYGYNAFFEKCQNTGVDGIIIPDLPFEERAEVSDVSSVYGVDLVSLIAPTSEGRVKKIAETATGFLYIVSSMGVTGVRSEISTDLASIIAAAKDVSNLPVAVGFGIHTPEQAARIAKVADGVIVGSAIVKIIEKHGENAGKYVFDFVNEFKTALKALPI